MQKKDWRKVTTEVIPFSIFFIWPHITTRFIQVQDEGLLSLLNEKHLEKNKMLSMHWSHIQIIKKEAL